MSNLELVLDYGGWSSSSTAGKNIICLPSLPKSPIPNVEILQNKLFQFGDALEWQYHLLEYVFQFLETRDLQAASSVNPVWERIASRELRRRLDPVWINFSYQALTRRSLHLQTSRGFTYGNTALGLFVYCSDMIKLEQYVWLDKTFNAKLCKMTSFAEYIAKEILPNGVDYCAISCSTMISASKSIMDTIIYRGMLIPFIPNIRTAMFHCDPQKPEEVSDHISANEQVKCVLLFTQQKRTFPENFFQSLLKKQNPKNVAIGGGRVNGTKIFNYNDRSRQKTAAKEHLFCITFLQEEGCEANFNAYSLVFYHNNTLSRQHQYEVFEGELVKLKQSSVLRKHGIIFHFRYFISVAKTETLLIEKYFPNYPLLGFGLDTDWVIGWNTLNIKNYETDGSNFEDSPTFKKLKTGVPINTHSRSALFVLVTWGKKI